MTDATLNFRRPSRLSVALPIRAAYSGNGIIAATGLFMLLCMIPTTLALVLDDRLFNGIDVWIKPLKFQFSLAVHGLTIAYLLLLLPKSVRQGWQIRVLTAALAVSTLFEAGYITLQAAQAAASHYNVATPFNALMYQIMGVGAVTLVVAAIWSGVLVLRHGDGPPVLVFSAGLGLVLGGLLGGVTGGWMSAQTGHWVGGVASDAGGLPLFGWARDGGDLRVAHFFGLHMMQMLPILGAGLWALGLTSAKGPVAIAAILGVFVTAGVFLQAASGRPFF